MARDRHSPIASHRDCWTSTLRFAFRGSNGGGAFVHGVRGSQPTGDTLRDRSAVRGRVYLLAEIWFEMLTATGPALVGLSPQQLLEMESSVPDSAFCTIPLRVPNTLQFKPF
ncbi:hypothetical protein CRG98_007209 [Punica granatum]|uniref:Uncharacterized protein n=1 Tax=Punica granatum TaxID=22663 RepID=A0A2I0KV55_PUNGR|nr:hypothetical protein CRG98_007209 [Punica granatum]